MRTTLEIDEIRIRSTLAEQKKRKGEEKEECIERRQKQKQSFF